MKKITIIILGLAVFLLAGCEQQPPKEVEDNVDSQVIIKNNDNQRYNSISPQPKSPSRGVTQNTASSNLDIDEMENGLMSITTEYANPNDFLYQPGQIITEDEAIALLEREYTTEQYDKLLEENDEALNIGLNPKLEEGRSEEETKLYVNTLIEQNYGTYNDEEDGIDIDTVSIGIGVPAEYTLEDETVVKISRDEVIDYASKEVTNRVIDYVRNYKGLEDVNILIGFYYESTESLLPGTYVTSAYVKGGSAEVEEYQEYNLEYVLYPSVDGQEYDSELNKAMSNINSQLLTYFSDYAGFYAKAAYDDKELVSINMTITVNLYSSIDAISFTNYVEELVLNEISSAQPIDIEIRNTNFEPVALVEIDQNKTQYKHIYD